MVKKSKQHPSSKQARSGRRMQTVSHKQVVVWTGYGLFALVLLGVILSTVIPMAALLFDPTTKHGNIILFLTALVLGATLSVALGYIVGYMSMRKASSVDRQYTGVVMGVLAYWLSTAFGAFGADSILSLFGVVEPGLVTLFVNLWPVVLSLVIVMGVAWGFQKHYNKQPDLVAYKPYGVLTVAAVLYTLIALPVWQMITSRQSSAFPLLTIVGIFSVLLLSYAALRRIKRSVLQRITFSAIGTGFALVALYATSQLLPFTQGGTSFFAYASTITAFAVSLAIWAVYLRVTATDPSL